MDEAALYLLLDHVAETERQDVEVTWEQLVAEPDAHRGRWIRLPARLRETKVRRLSSVKRWPRPVFVSLLLDEGGQRAVSFIGTEGSAISRGKPVWVEGYFFKVRRDEPRGTTQPVGSEPLDVPVIVGRALVARNPWIDRRTGTPSIAISVTVLAVLLVLYLYVRRLTRGRKEGGGRGLKPACSVLETEPEDRSAEDSVPINLDSFEPGSKDGDSLSGADDSSDEAGREV